MPDFLASLRTAATDFMAQRQEAKEVIRHDDQIRQGQDYRNAAQTRFGDVPAPAPAIGADPLNDAYRRGRAASLLSGDLEDTRGGVDLARDTTLDVASGIATGALNLAALGLSGVSKYNNLTTGNPDGYDLGVPVAGFAKRTGEFLGKLKTREAQEAAAAYAVSSDVLTDENAAAAQQYVNEGGNPYVAQAGRIFSDVGDTSSNLFQSPQQLQSGLSQGVGSLLVGGPIAKGAAITAEAAAGALAARGLMSARMATMVTQAAEHGAMTATITGMEAGGAYAQASQAVMDTSHEDLMQHSPMYADMIRSGVPKDDARNRVASQAGEIAATIQAPVAAATGHLVAKFEANPLSARTIRGALQDVGKETIEEGIQSFSGQLASNAGVRYVDDRQDLVDGLGSNLAEGAIFGAGTAGVFAGPNVALGAAERIPGAVRDTVSGIKERGRKINEANKITPEMTAQAVKRAAEPVAPSADPEIEVNLPVLSSLAQQFHFDQKTYQPRSAGEARLVSTMDPEGQYDIWDVIDRGSKLISSPNVPAEEKTDLAVMLFSLYQGVTDDSIEQVSDLQGKATPGGALAGELDRIIGAQEALRNNPHIMEALTRGLEATPEVTVDDLDLTTEEGQKAALKVAAQAVVSPESVSPEVADALEQQAAANPDVLAPSLVNTVRSTAALNRTYTQALAEAEATGAEAPNPVKVARNIQVDSYDKKNTAGPSVRSHYDNVLTAMNHGNEEAAKEALQEFNQFAQHMANKLNAVNESYQSRGPGNVQGRSVDDANQTISFDSYNPTTKQWTPDGGSIGTVRFATGSVALGQQVGVDAGMVIQSYNDLVQQFPQLGGKTVDEVQLDPNLRRKPAEVVAAARKEQASKKPKQEAPKPAPQEETVSELVTPPVVEEVAEPAKVEEAQEPAADPVAEAPPVDTSSRFTPEEAEALRPDELTANMVLMQDRVGQAEERSTDKATLEILQAERERREQPEPAPEAVAEVVEPEAEPEVQTTEATAEVVKNTPQIEEVFPNVIRDTNGQQLLHDGFTVDAEGRSRLVGEDAIGVQQVSEALQSPEAFQDLTGMGKYKINEQVSAAYNATLNAVLTKVFPIMDKHLQASKHFKPYLQGKDPTNAMRRVNLRLMNLLERTEDGGLQFNAQIAEAATLALSDWLAQNSVAGPSRSDEDIARKLKVPVSEITPELRLAYNSGSSSQQAHDALATSLSQFLGLKAKSDVKNGLTDGLMLSLAHELLVSAQEAGLIEATEPMKVGDRYVAFMKTNRAYLGEEGTFAGQTTLISQIVLQDETIAGYTVGKPSGNALKYLQGRGAPTTDAQNATAKRENAIPQKVNRPMLDLYRHLGVDGVVELFGNGQLDETLNKNDRKTREGQNLSFLAAYETSMGVVQEMEAAAQEQGIELEEVKLFREYAFSSVNRLQQQGQYGDQSSKLTRELITPNGVVLDMTVPENASMFRRALAQAFGVKVEKRRQETWEAELDAFLAKPDTQSVLQIMSDPTATPSDQLIAALKGVLDPSGKKGVAVVQVHALQAYADFLNASDPSEFFTHAYVEADGVTDGPTNSLIYMRTGGFDTEMVEGLARGGLLFTSAPTPLHAIFDPEDGMKTKDTYEVGGDRLAARLSDHINDAILSAEGPEQQQAMADQSDALIRAMRILLGGQGFSYIENEQGERTYTIGRNQLKNPLTVTVYGSSPAGIAAKIANEMVRLVYQEISLANAKAKEDGTKDWHQYMFNSTELYNEFFGALAQIGRNETRVIRNRVTGVTQHQVIHNASAKVVQNFSDAVEFTITPSTVKNLTQAVQALYVTPMVDAINQGMGSSVNGSGLIQRATNFMSVLARNAFTNAIQAELKRQVAQGGSLADGLSPDDLKKVLDRVAFLLPYMEDDSITVNVKGLSKGLMDDKPDSDTESAVRPAAGFTDGAHTKLTIPMPTIAGVSGAAYVNISYGDGRMIIEASPNIVGGRLMVFDGINLALDKAQKNGEAINASVLKAIQTGTPFQDLNKTFSNMVETLGLDAFAPTEQAQIVRDLTPASFKEKVNSTEFIQSMMFQLKSELDSAVIDEKARQAVLNSVHISSDHMAALAAPASTADDTSREDLGNLTTQDQAARLEAMFREERSKLVEQAAEPAPKDDLGTFVDGLKTDSSGARVVDTNGLLPLVNGMKVPAQQKTLMQRALSALEGTNWTVAFGDTKQANEFAKKNNVPFSFGKGDLGLTDAARKFIILTNNSAETLAHELIHAATIDRVVAYYADPNSVDQVSREAIGRLEALMQEWISVAPEVAALRNQKTRTAVSNALRTVTSYLEDGKQSEALNEFMAWNLSNQELAKLNSDIKVESTLARVARGVLDGLKKLFGFPGKDMASNIRFNSMVIMRDGMPAVASHAAATLLEQTTRERPDLRQIKETFTEMLKTADANMSNKGTAPSVLALRYGYQLAQLASANGFPLSAEERSTFARIVAAYRANTVKNPKLNTQMDVFMREVQEQLNQSLMMDDPTSQDPGALNTATDRINLLNGSIDVGNDAAGRSLLVPMFVALGATSSVAQGLFNRIEMRDRKAAAPGTTLDSWLKAHASNAVDSLMDWSYGLRPNQKIGEQLQDLIASEVAEQDALRGQLTQALEAPANLVRELNEKGVDLMAKAIDMTSDGLDFLVAQSKGTKAEPYAKMANNIAQTALNIFHKDKVHDASSNIFSMINETSMPQELRALFTELLGVTRDNVDILQLVKLVRSSIHRVRQTYRKLLPQRIVEQFKNPVSKEQWEHIHRGLGQTDLAVLLDHGLSSGAIIDLLTNPTEVKRLLDQKQADIIKLFTNSKEILSDAGDLAEMMLTGAPPHGYVRRNALAIANRVGTVKVNNIAQDSAEVRAIDGYVSLLALSQLSKEEAASLSGLASSDRDGMSYTLSQIAQARRSEMSRVSDQLRFNVPKGYMPYEKVGNMVAVPMDKLNEYTAKGYRVVGTRQRGSAEALYDARAGDRVYVSTDVPTPAFKQGILQTVRSTVFGLDAASGLSHDNPTGGLITDPIIVKRLTSLLSRGGQKENLSPMFNEHGQIYAYERLINRAEVDSTIETQRNAAVAVGHWIGRQFEEVQSSALNDVLVDRLTKRWTDAGNRATEDEFVDLFELAKTDPIVADAVKLINFKDRQNIIDKMGGRFMVERSLYEQVLGYRSMSIGDLWTGNTRLGQEHRESLANFLTGLFGPETYRRLTAAETAWTNLMGDARVAIVVKSVLVPVINGVANFYQLLGNGIGPLDIAKKSAEKLRETHLYAQNYLRHQALEADLSAAKGEKRPDRIRQIEVEMRKIEDLNKRLSIYPLIKAGEFTQVTEGLTQDDLEMTRGRIWDRVSTLADKLPPSVKTAGRYALVAKDTALFEGLARTVSYTDFVAKAVLYDHLTKTKKQDHTDALLHVTNEFVNYDLLGGRARAKAEEVGLIWFWAFKLRSIKVAATMVRENPLHALLTGFVPGVEKAGTVFDDNALALFSNGRWLNSLGPDNALRALSLNPVGQLF